MDPSFQDVTCSCFCKYPGRERGFFQAPGKTASSLPDFLSLVPLMALQLPRCRLLMSTLSSNLFSSLTPFLHSVLFRVSFQLERILFSIPLKNLNHGKVRGAFLCCVILEKNRFPLCCSETLNAFTAHW